MKPISVLHAPFPGKKCPSIQSTRLWASGYRELFPEFAESVQDLVRISLFLTHDATSSKRAKFPGVNQEVTWFIHTSIDCFILGLVRRKQHRNYPWAGWALPYMQ
jgi:hypothetical protein